MAADITADNGRVTLALLGQKLDTVIEVQKAILDSQHKHDERLSLLERCTDVHAERIKSVEEDVTHVNSRDRWGTIGTTIAAVVAGFIAVFKP